MPEPAGSTNSDLETFKKALAQFKSTGSVDFDVVSLAKEKFLPSVGVAPSEIQNMGPGAVMVRLEEELAKNSAQVTATNANLANLTTEVENLSHKINDEINEEIKRQLSQHPSSETVQQELDKVVNKVDPSEKETQSPPNLPQSPPLTSEQVHSYNLNPLQASLEAALADLKEGDRVNDEWSLRRISNTSFGNTQTPFYELQNATGAVRTLNQEEMKELLKAQIVDQSQSPPSYESLQPASLPRVDINPHPTNLFDEELPEKESTDTQNEQKKDLSESQKEELTPKQIEFLKKIASNKSQWSALTSFTPEQWQTFSKLYSQGKLAQLGIAASPLLDLLNDPDSTKNVTIKKGDNIQNLLEQEGLKLSYTADDALLLGIHLLLNYQLIEGSHHKIEESGIAIEPLPAESDLLNLTKKARGGDLPALNSLKDSLTFLPVEGNFKIIKSEKFDQLQKLLAE